MNTFSYSGIRDWRKCPQLFWYRRVDKLERRIQASPLKKGILIHELVETYLRGERVSPVLKKIATEYDKLWEEEKELYGDLPHDLADIMRAYIKEYPDDPSMTKEVELDFKIPLGDFFLTGKIDWIMEDRRGIWVMDHKSSKNRIPNEGFRLFDLQTGLYAYAATVLGYEPRGIGFNYIRSAPVTKPQMTQRGTLNKRKINTDMHTLMTFLRKHDLDPDDYPEQIARAKTFRRFSRKTMIKPQGLVDRMVEDFQTTAEEIALFIESQRSPVRNLSKDCEYCDFNMLCTSELMDLDTDYLLKAEYRIKKKREEVKDTDDED